MMFSKRAVVALTTGVALVAGGCGTDTSSGSSAESGRPTIVVTTTILGDVVENLVGEQFAVVTVMPVGADPHGFQASAQQVATIGEAEVLIVNGAGFEESLLDVIEAAHDDGVAVFEAISAVETIEFGDDDYADHDQETDTDDHEDEDEDEDEDDHEDNHADEDHGHDGVDPHFWNDPVRVAAAADAIVSFLIAENIDNEGVDADALRRSAAAYVDGLDTLDVELTQTLAAIDEDRRVLVTNHDAFGYFADRYDFEVVGTVIPSGSTADGASAQQLAELAETIEHEAVPAIFAETTVSDELAQTLATEAGGDIAIVDLYSGSLGAAESGADTYMGMMRTNAQRIADALAG